eukprot:TRINITY_DN16820_c0_g1_i1.p1 TRINITY_DN16820_c0_g1~~TRINITY_DN16820_c0_g1_i1.p1  ORF type:complete len:245 (+),score=62.61 TRINITY_DN16820_c0_g1_i1:102-836(+)
MRSLLISIILVFFFFNLSYQQKYFNVTGFAKDFVTFSPIKNADLTVLETGEKLKTDSEGNFTLSVRANTNITLLLEHSFYHKTQTGTTYIDGDFNTAQKQITLQVPDSPTFDFLSIVVPGIPRSDRCHLVVTVSAANKTLYDDPQGEPGATCNLIPDPGATPFYFGMFKNGKTNPFERGLNVTSQDGGVLWVNVKKGDYKVVCTKPGVVFNDPPYSYLSCNDADGRLINAAPPLGPRVSPNTTN